MVILGVSRGRAVVSKTMLAVCKYTIRRLFHPDLDIIYARGKDQVLEIATSVSSISVRRKILRMNSICIASSKI
jgi:hypothetical protein